MPSFRLRASAPALLVCAFAIGCGNGAPNNDTPANFGGGGSGGNSSGGMSSAGTGILPMGGQTPGGSSSGGMSTAGDAGSGGAAGAAGGGTGGASGSGSGGAGSCSKMGTQADPGTEGDGKKQVDGPYKPAPETQMHLNNAPVGKINDMPIGAQIPAPLIYAATKQYPGLNQMLKYEYWIYVPSQYNAGCPAAMMVFQDGMHYVSTDSQFHIPVVFDNLIASGDIPVTIGVFINPGEPGSGHYDGNEQPNRSAQYDRNSPDYVNFPRRSVPDGHRLTEVRHRRRSGGLGHQWPQLRRHRGVHGRLVPPRKVPQAVHPRRQLPQHRQLHEHVAARAPSTQPGQAAARVPDERADGTWAAGTAPTPTPSRASPPSSTTSNTSPRRADTFRRKPPFKR